MTTRHVAFIYEKKPEFFFPFSFFFHFQFYPSTILVHLLPLLLLFLSAVSTTASFNYRRRLLHQPFFPVTSLPQTYAPSSSSPFPSPQPRQKQTQQPKYPFSTTPLSTPSNSFLPFLPFPSAASVATLHPPYISRQHFTTSISVPNAPLSSKSKLSFVGRMDPRRILSPGRVSPIDHNDYFEEDRHSSHATLSREPVAVDSIPRSRSQSFRAKIESPDTH